MIISRVKSGFFMLSGSIVLFGLAAILTDDSLPETKAAALTPFQDLFVIVSIVSYRREPYTISPKTNGGAIFSKRFLPYSGPAHVLSMPTMSERRQTL